MKIGASPAAAYYLIAILMSNITNCLQGNQTSKRLQCNPLSLEKYLHLEIDEEGEVDSDTDDQVETEVDNDTLS